MIIKDVQEVNIAAGQMRYWGDNVSGTVIHTATAEITLKVLPNGYYRITVQDERDAALRDSLEKP